MSQGDKTNDQDEVDFKNEHKYAEHMQTDESQAVSDFAIHKTIKEQREFLPIYAVKQEVSIAVVVKEGLGAIPIPFPNFLSSPSFPSFS